MLLQMVVLSSDQQPSYALIGERLLSLHKCIDANVAQASARAYLKRNLASLIARTPETVEQYVKHQVGGENLNYLL